MSARVTNNACVGKYGSIGDRVFMYELVVNYIACVTHITWNVFV
jgi:hypothetical protein